MATWWSNTVGGMFNSLNVFRLTGDFRYNRERHEQVSPEQLEAVVKGYNKALGIPKAGEFERLINAYIEEQDKALTEFLKTKGIPDINAPSALSAEDRKKYDELQNVKKLLKSELAGFTEKLTNLPAHTHADALRAVLQEEQAILLETLKALNKGTQQFRENVVAVAPATAAGTGPAAAGTGPAAAVAPVGATAAADLSAALDTMGKKLDTAQTESFDELETNLTNVVTDAHRATQLERDRIGLFATLEGNKRKLSVLKSTIKGIGDIRSWFTSKPIPDNSVLMMGSEQAGVDKLLNAMRMQDFTGQDELKETEAKLATAKTRLKKATDDGDDAQIKKSNDEIKKYEAELKALHEKIAQGAQRTAAAMQSKDAGSVGHYLGLAGWDPGLLSLSGQSINVTANGQGLGFALDFPRPIFSPGFYTNSAHNTKADLVCLAELVRASGSETIITSVTCKNDERALKLAQEAYEAALEVGFPDDKITINVNGKAMSHDDLYKHPNKEGKEDGKYASKKQHAEKLKQIKAEERARVDAKKQPEIAEQQQALRAALQGGRNELEAARKALDPKAPDPDPAPDPAPTA